MTDCLTCPEPGNYAAVATSLQNTAMQAEACIFDLEHRLREAVNPATLIMGVSLGSSPPNVSIQFTLGTVLYANSAYVNFLNPLPRGVYQAGLYFNVVAVGAVTDNSYRVARISTRNVYAALPDPDEFTALQTTLETNTGAGMDLCITTIIESDGNSSVNMYMQHGNTGSNCTATGYGWITRLSDLDTPRVVA